MDIDHVKTIHLDYWCGSMAGTLNRRFEQAFSDRLYLNHPRLTGGLNLFRAVRKMGEFEAAVHQALDTEEVMMAQGKPMVVFGTPASWVGSVLAQGGRVSVGLKERVKERFASFDVIAWPGDADLVGADGCWFADAATTHAMTAATFAFIAPAFDPSRQTMITVGELISILKGRGRWR
ncbi:MAG: hypothetical protein HQL79_07450 [Magnetococcales bacterium]|nr:hypothetical protein [Magnetococcales bacterium]